MAADGQAPGVQITVSREMDSQLPRRVTVQHLDYDREYNTGTQYAERINTAAINALLLARWAGLVDGSNGQVSLDVAPLFESVAALDAAVARPGPGSP